MSSSGEQGPSAGLLVRAKEAAKNPHLAWIGERVPSPRQAAVVCQILGLTNEEEKNAKAAAVLKRDWPVLFEQLFSKVSEAENKKKEKQEMRPVFQQLKGQKVNLWVSGIDRQSMTEITGKVGKVGKTYVELQEAAFAHEGSARGGTLFINYQQIVMVQ